MVRFSLLLASTVVPMTLATAPAVALAARPPIPASKPAVAAVRAAPKPIAKPAVPAFRAAPAPVARVVAPLPAHKPAAPAIRSSAGAARPAAARVTVPVPAIKPAVRASVRTAGVPVLHGAAAKPVATAVVAAPKSLPPLPAHKPSLPSAGPLVLPVMTRGATVSMIRPGVLREAADAGKAMRDRDVLGTMGYAVKALGARAAGAQTTGTLMIETGKGIRAHKAGDRIGVAEAAVRTGALGIAAGIGSVAGRAVAQPGRGADAMVKAMDVTLRLAPPLSRVAAGPFIAFNNLRHAREMQRLNAVPAVPGRR